MTSHPPFPVVKSTAAVPNPRQFGTLPTQGTSWSREPPLECHTGHGRLKAMEGPSNETKAISGPQFCAIDSSLVSLFQYKVVPTVVEFGL